MSAHSAIVGGATAGRLLACPGSYQAILALPPSVEAPSPYAERGTRLHKVMEEFLLIRLQEPLKLDWAFLASYHTPEDFAAIKSAFEHLSELEAFYGGGFQVIAVEQHVKFPGIPGAFGTLDLILANDAYVLHVDWKFGTGVGVRAVTDHGDSETVNPQLLYYIAAAKADHRSLYSGRQMVGAIIQPGGSEPLTHTVITNRDLKWFREDLDAAVVKALSPNPPRWRGEHCRWAPCKATCPEWTGPMLDLSALGQAPPQVVAADHADAAAYGQYLADAKRLADMAALYKKEIDDQLHAFLEAGGTVPGWRLKAKAKLRQWVDEKRVVRELKKLGFELDQIYQRKLTTFQAADSVARELGVEIPDDLRVAPETNETTIATTDDPAPVVDRSQTVELFRASLKLLQKGN